MEKAKTLSWSKCSCCSKYGSMRKDDSRWVYFRDFICTRCVVLSLLYSAHKTPKTLAEKEKRKYIEKNLDLILSTNHYKIVKLQMEF